MKLYGMMLAMLAVLTGGAYDLSWVRVNANCDIEIVKSDSDSKNIKSFYQNWGEEAKRKQLVTFEITSPGSDKWTEFKFAFRLPVDGKVTLNLQGPYQKTGDRLERINVVFSEIKVEGAVLKNGAFADIAAGKPAWWNMYCSNSEAAPICAKGKIVVWHNGTYNQTIDVPKDTVITVSGKCRMANPSDLTVLQASQADKKYENAPDVPVSLAKVANMAFADDKADDGKGGWSDQGRENDMNGFPVERTNFGGVTFVIVDPAANAQKSVLSLNMRNNGVKQAKIELPEAFEARYLYLLHSSCFNQQPGTLGQIKVQFADGKSQIIDVVTNQDIADWWNAGEIANGSVVYRKQNASSSVGVYLSKFLLSENPAQVKSIEFISVSPAIWVVAGATLSNRNANLPKDMRFVAKADNVWRPIDMSPVFVKENSALDLSYLVEPGPAGKYGRALIDPDGNFAFEKRPAKPVRFFAFNAFANHLMSRPDSLLMEGSNDNIKQLIRDFAVKVRRQGYNMVRLQGIDILLMGYESSYAKFDPKNLDALQYLLFCLKQEGIYFGIDLFSYTGYDKFKSQWYDAMALNYKERMYFDPKARQMWLDGVTNLLTARNPYTKLTLIEEPALVYVDMHNEQELGIWTTPVPMTKGGVQPFAEKAYREFLQKRYGDVGVLEKSWKLAAGTYKSFDDVPLFVKNDIYLDNAKGKDVNEFIYGVEQEMIDFYRKGLAAVNFETYATLYDVLGQYRFVSLKRDMPVITVHGYHNHPSSGLNSGSRMAQNSIVSVAALYYRYMAGSRVWNRPYLVTEYNAPFWGKYRHQEGLLFASYSALQNYAAITAHQIPVNRIPAAMDDFYIGRDPINRAGQVVAAFAYGRSDVKTSPHKVAVAVSDEYMRNHITMNRGMSSEQNRIALLSGLGLVLDGKIPAGLPPYPKFDLTLLPAGGSEIVATAMFAVAIDKVDGKNFENTVELLRQKGILDKGNRTDVKKEVYESDTGELLMSVKDNCFTVNTPKLQGVAYDGKKEIKLDAVAVTASLPSSSTVIAVDNVPIKDSKRLLIVFTTDALNTGTEFSEDRTVLYKPGVLPVLVEGGKLEVKVANPNAFEAYALNNAGERVESLPVTRQGDKTVFTVDTAKLAKGIALYFELVTP